METTGFCDWREVKDELRLNDDSRFNNHRFASAVRKANGEILDALRPRYAVNDLLLENQTTETITGTTTSEVSNSLTVSTASWTVNAFAESSIGMKLEAVIYVDATPVFWIADVVSNTATAIIVSDIDDGDITVPSGASFYLRIKQPGLNNIGIAFGMYQFLINNRAAQGLNVGLDAVEARRDEESVNLGLYIGGALALITPTVTDAITFDGGEWQRLSKKNIDSQSFDYVTSGGSNYYSEQGFEVDYVSGRIRFKTPDSDQKTVLTQSSTISITYRYRLRGNVSGAV